MPDCSAPPFTQPPWNEFSGFRQTMLFRFTRPDQAIALRVVSEMFFELAMEASQDWPDLPGSITWHEMEAAEADVRHLATFLAEIGRERGATQFSPAEYKLATLAAKVGKKMTQLAEDLRKGLAAGVDAAPPRH